MSRVSQAINFGNGVVNAAMLQAIILYFPIKITHQENILVRIG